MPLLDKVPSRRRGLFLAALLSLRALSAHAEGDISISGIVVDDSTGLPVEAATVRVDGIGVTTLSDGDGEFVFRALPLGAWRLSAERSGYQTRTESDVRVVEGHTRRVRLALIPAPVVLSPQSVSALQLPTDGIRRIDVAAQRAQASSIADLLDGLPGVRVYGGSDSPGGTRISVGGEPPSRVVVMLDGLPLSGGSDGAVDLSTIPVSAITAIEVHPGSQTVLAGDAAVGGAVNLITKPSSGSERARVSSSAGEWGMARHELTGLVLKGANQVFLGGDYGRRGSRYEFAPARSETSGIRRNASVDERRLHARWDRTRNGAFEIMAFGSRIERGAPGTLERPFATAFTRNKNVRVQSSRGIFENQRHHLMVAAWYEFTSEYYNASRERIPFHTYLRENFVGGRAAYSRTVLAGRLHTEVEARWRFIHGEDFQRPSLSFGDESRAEYTIRALWSRPFHRFVLRSGLALDADNSNSPTWTPRVDLDWLPLGDFTLGLGWGRSFRRPLLMSAFWKSDYYTQGNPDLLPERAAEWDISVGWRNHWLTADTRYFERTISDIIVWDLRGVPQKYTPVNLASGSVIGREDYAGLRLLDGSVEVGYSHVFNLGTDQSGEPNYDGKVLPFTPRHTHDLTLRLTAKRIWLHCAGRWVSRREALRSNTNRWQAPYRVFDIEARVKALETQPRLTLFARVDNLTDEFFELLQGYPSPGRSLTAGLTLGFN